MMERASSQTSRSRRSPAVSANLSFFLSHSLTHSRSLSLSLSLSLFRSLARSLSRDHILSYSLAPSPQNYDGARILSDFEVQTLASSLRVLSLSLSLAHTHTHALSLAFSLSSSLSRSLSPSSSLSLSLTLSHTHHLSPQNYDGARILSDFEVQTLASSLRANIDAEKLLIS